MTVERAFIDAQALVEEVELIILAVPDDALAPLAATIRMYGGQAMIHTGALGAEVLEPAQAAGTQIGSFHPLVAFADTERAVAALHGATVAIEGDDQLLELLAEMAERIGACRPAHAGLEARLPRRRGPRGGGFVALLDAIAELGRVAGLDEAGALAIYGPLIEGTLGNARALGIRAALTGRSRAATTARCEPTWRRSRPMRQAFSRCNRSRRARDQTRRGAARRHRQARRPCVRHLHRSSEPLPLLAMEHSIAAKYAARPAARSVRPSARTRERRLGLRVTGTFRASEGRATVLRRADLGRLSGCGRAGGRSAPPFRSAP